MPLVAFRMLRSSFPKLDLYELLRLPLEDVTWEWDDFWMPVSAPLIMFELKQVKAIVYLAHS